MRAWMEDGCPHVVFYDSGRGILPAIRRFLNEGQMPDSDVHLMGLRIVRQIIIAHEGTISVTEDGQEIEVRFQPIKSGRDWQAGQNIFQ